MARRTREISPSTALLDAVREDPVRPSEATIAHIRQKMERVRELDLLIAQKQEELRTLQSARADIVGGGSKRGELVDLFEQSQIKNMELGSSGNKPGVLFELEDWTSISQSRMSAVQKSAMFSWLRRNELASLIRDTFTIELDRGDDKKAEMIEKFLRSRRVAFDREPSVNSGTLKAEVRRRAKAGQPLAPSDLETLGVSTGRVMSVKPLG